MALYKSQGINSKISESRKESELKKVRQGLEWRKETLVLYGQQFKKNEVLRWKWEKACDSIRLSSTEENPTLPTCPPELWEIGTESTHAKLDLFGRLFALKGYVRSSTKEVKFSLMLSQRQNELSVCAAVHELTHEIVTYEERLRTLLELDNDVQTNLESALDVAEMEGSTSVAEDTGV